MDQKVVSIAKQYAQKVASRMSVEMVVLYGSQRDGTATEGSDIDIAVVVDRFEGDYLKASAELFSLVRDINNRIEPVLLSRAHDAGGFLGSILKRGKIIYSAGRR